MLLDTSSRVLRSHGKLIRVRRVGTHTLLTYKGPSEQSRYKKRHEIEVVLPDAFKVEQIFNEIGYHPIFRYEKFRTEYAKALGAGKVLLDETPIGNYWRSKAALAGSTAPRVCSVFRPADYITRSYGYLYLAYCRERRMPPSDMLFTAERDAAASQEPDQCLMKMRSARTRPRSECAMPRPIRWAWCTMRII